MAGSLVISCHHRVKLSPRNNLSIALVVSFARMCQSPALGQHLPKFPSLGGQRSDGLSISTSGRVERQFCAAENDRCGSTTEVSQGRGNVGFRGQSGPQFRATELPNLANNRHTAFQRLDLNWGGSSGLIEVFIDTMNNFKDESRTPAKEYHAIGRFQAAQQPPLFR